MHVSDAMWVTTLSLSIRLHSEQLATYYIGDIVDEEKKFNKQSTKK